MAGERSADEIQRDIEQSRVALAQTVDELAFRTNPKRVVENTKASLRARAQTPEGKIVIYAGGGLIVLLILRKIRKH